FSVLALPGTPRAFRTSAACRTGPPPVPPPPQWAKNTVTGCHQPAGVLALSSELKSHAALVEQLADTPSVQRPSCLQGERTVMPSTAAVAVEKAGPVTGYLIMEYLDYAAKRSASCSSWRALSGHTSPIPIAAMKMLSRITSAGASTQSLWEAC